MKTLLILLFAVIVSCVLAQRRPHSHVSRIVNGVNTHPRAKWNATLNNDFSDKSDDEVKRFLGAFVPQHTPNSTARTFFVRLAKDVPTKFDSRDKWPRCVHSIRDQQECGSCWAFAASGVLSDRFCIASGGSINTVLSPQDMVSCDSRDHGCDGGSMVNSWSYLTNTGIVPDSCFPYTSGRGSVSSCPRTCPATGDSFSSQKKKAKNFYHVTSNIESEIMKNGPVEAGMSVYRDFYHYSTGVYSHIYGDYMGGHAVKIVGWGSSGSTPYWIVANSWGTRWGMQGYFWITRGENECGIEDNVYAGLPSL